MSEQQPSKESLREVKREYKERRKADKERQKAADKYWAEQTNPGGSSGSKAKVSTVGTAILTVGAISAVFLGVGAFQNMTHSNKAQTIAADPTTSPSASRTKLPSPSSTTMPVPGNTDPLPLIPLSLDPSIPKLQLGDAGLVAPAAKPVAGFSADEVADAYHKTLEYLHTATLEPHVVLDGKIKPVLNRFSNRSAEFAIAQHALSQSSKGRSGIPWAQMANRFRPGDWTTFNPVKNTADGVKLSAKKGRFQGTLEVDFYLESAYQLIRQANKGLVTVYVIRKGGLSFDHADSTSVTKPDVLSLFYKTLPISDKPTDCGKWADIDYLEAC